MKCQNRHVEHTNLAELIYSERIQLCLFLLLHCLQHKVPVSLKLLLSNKFMVANTNRFSAQLQWQVLCYSLENRASVIDFVIARPSGDQYPLQWRHNERDVSRITCVSIVSSTVYSGAGQEKTSKLRVTGLCDGYFHRWTDGSNSRQLWREKFSSHAFYWNRNWPTIHLFLRKYTFKEKRNILVIHVSESTLWRINTCYRYVFGAVD